MDPIEVEIEIDVPEGAPLSKAFDPAAITPHIRSVLEQVLKDRDYVRDDRGRFSETGGGGGEGEGRDDDVDRGESGGRIDDDSIPDIVQDDIVPPARGVPVHNPFIDKDSDGDGVTDSARVGIRANLVMPPPSQVPALPNLSKDERIVETGFREQFEKDPQGQAQRYLDEVGPVVSAGGPMTFETDGAKLLDKNWNPPKDADITDEERLDRKAMYNVATHQTAHAITKLAFVKYLDEVVSKYDEGDPRRNVLVTAGGCGAGKGFALKKIPDMLALKASVGAIWDAAGDQNSTENPWIQAECEKRGIKTTYAWVDADPSVSWADENAGVVQRAKTAGRMVDASVFSDSYALGGRNFKAFADSKPKNAEFVYIKNRIGEKPVKVDSMPEETLKIDRRKLYEQSRQVVLERAKDLGPAITRGALVGDRVWHRRPTSRRARSGSGGSKGGRRGEGSSLFEREPGGERRRPRRDPGALPAVDRTGAHPRGKALPPAEGGLTMNDWRTWKARRALFALLLPSLAARAPKT